MNISIKNIKLTPHIILCVFLVTHVLLWSLLPLLREILPIDAAECIIWGSYMDFGTNKHPPLAGWLAYWVYNIFKSDYSIYLLGQICIATGFVYIYKLGKIFLDDIKALFAVLLLETCYVYTYMGIYEGFNPNFILLALYPFLAYYFYKCLNEDNIKNWVFLGVGFGLGFIGKYQILMIFLSMLIYLIFTETGRKQFKNKGLYISAIIALFIVLPHFMWMYNHDFFSLNYFKLCELQYTNHYFGWSEHIKAPVFFILNQILTLITVLFIYFTAILFSNKKICFNNNINNDKSKFLITVGILPIILQTFPSIINGSYLVPQWGYCLLSLNTILLFYFFPFELSKKVIKYFAFWIVSAIFVSSFVLGYIFYTEKSFASRFPVEQVTKTLSEKYTKETGKPLKYIGGFIELTIPLELYNKDYIAVLNTYKYPNPWINTKDLKESGAIVIGRYQDLMRKYVRTTAPYYNEEFEIKDFYITVKNHLGKEKVYKMYYVIIPAIKNFTQ